MGEGWSKEDTKGCFQVILYMIGFLILGMIFYAVLDGIDALLNSIPWYLWLIIIVVVVWVLFKGKK